MTNLTPFEQKSTPRHLKVVRVAQEASVASASTVGIVCAFRTPGFLEGRPVRLEELASRGYARFNMESRF